MTSYRILVTGSRDWADRDRVFDEIGNACLRAIHAGYYSVVVVHGGARGADQQASKYVRSNRVRAMDATGVELNEEVHPVTPEQWRANRGAGIVRNHKMVALGANECLAFGMPCTRCAPETLPHPTHGTKHCALTASTAGIPTLRFGEVW
jgi:hypothetical protein